MHTATNDPRPWLPGMQSSSACTTAMTPAWQLRAPLNFGAPRNGFATCPGWWREDESLTTRSIRACRKCYQPKQMMHTTGWLVSRIVSGGRDAHSELDLGTMVALDMHKNFLPRRVTSGYVGQTHIARTPRARVDLFVDGREVGFRRQRHDCRRVEGGSPRH